MTGARTPRTNAWSRPGRRSPAERKPAGEGVDEERALLRSVYERGQPWGLTWNEWGRHLLAARRLGLLQLTRWDLASDPEKMEANVVRDGPRESHLLVL